MPSLFKKDTKDTVVLDCTRLQNTPINPEGTKFDNTKSVLDPQGSIYDLLNPPEIKEVQLKKDIEERNGIIINNKGKITLCRDLEELKKVENIPPKALNYILRTGHQGLFAGGASLFASQGALTQNSAADPMQLPSHSIIELEKKILLTLYVFL